jgi:hypothetical protein
MEVMTELAIQADGRQLGDEEDIGEAEESRWALPQAD